MIICPSLLYFPIFENWWSIAENCEQNVTAMKNSIFTKFDVYFFTAEVLKY